MCDPYRRPIWEFIGSTLFYLSHVSEMSPVVLQLFPTLAPHRAGCISPLKKQEQLGITNKKENNYMIFEF